MKWWTRKQVARFEREALAHLDAVYRFALALTHDQTEAEDLVQETYLKALRAFGSYEEGTQCKAWLFKILRNTFINRMRVKGREVEMDERIEGLGVPGAFSLWSSEPETAAILSATREQLMGALSRLPPEFREAVELADIEGLAYKEIAEVMGTPIGTVMSRLHRGRRMMRELLEKRQLRASDVVQLVPLQSDGESHGL